MNNLSRRSFLLYAIVLVAVILGGCGTPAPSQSSSSTSPSAPDTTPDTTSAPTTPEQDTSADTNDTNDTLRLLSWQAPTILNPHLARGSKDYIACRVTYEPLASYDQDGTLVPFLAAEIPSLENGLLASDGTSVTWKLRHDVRWSDGEPFTASDVVFTYELITNPQVAATSDAQYDAVERVEIIDDYTVQVHFTDVNPAWAYPFVGPRGMILPRHIFEKYAGPTIQEAPANQQPVGTGPYRVVDFVPGDVVVYEPNPYFREPDKPYFGRVELKGGGDATSAARAVLQTGDVDFSANLQVEAQILENLAQSDQGTLMTISRPLVEHVLINQTDPNQETSEGERSSTQFPHPFFSDKTVRQAFAHAIDRETIANQLYGPNGEPTHSILVEPQIYHSPNTFYKYDLDKAAALLDEAGWQDSDGDGIRDKDGVSMHVLFQTATGSVRQKTQEIIKQSLESIGVEVELKSIDPAIFFDNDPSNTETYSHFYADMQMFTIPYDSPDPGAYMQGWICDEMPQKANNWSANNIERWCNPTYDDLYEATKTEMDPEQRRQLFIEMNDLLVSDVALIPIVHRKRVVGVSTTLEGVELSPWDEDVWKIADWKRK